ncbi:MAG: hypothetical protein LUD47_07445 [Clostridia bacterium]|nr:hypothetical protein [Clostridia bacterium]
MNLLTIFILLNIANVVGSTIRSLCTINCNKWVASLVNSVYFGFYTVVIVYTLCDLPLLMKAGVVALCNLVGVFIVKFIQEKLRKDRLWKIELTVKNRRADELAADLSEIEIPYNYVDAGPHTIFNIYCATQKESAMVKTLVERYHAKYFVTETKLL